jgi:hypothetical protein
MNPTRCTASVLFSIALASTAHAKKDADLKPMLAKPGKSLIEETFSDSALNKPWRALKGDWQIKDATLIGENKASDNHAAVVSCGVPNHNSIVRFSFKIEGKKGFNLSYNSAKGHLFRVLVSPSGVSINKDGSKTDATIKPENLATKKDEIEVGKWHTLQVEVLGPKVYVQTDTGIKLEASHPALDVDKSGYNFVGGGLALDDLKAWQAE